MKAKYDEKYADRIESMRWSVHHGYARHSRWNGERVVWKSMHRLVWLWEYGELPKCIDHINGNRLDNRLCNLRAATNSLNSLNRSDVSGCWPNGKGKFEASITHQGKPHHLGTFDPNEQATAAYRAKRDEVIAYEAAVAAGQDPTPPGFPNLFRGRPRCEVDVQRASEMYAAGASADEIGKALGATGCTVRNRLRDAGVTMRGVGRPKKHPLASL